MKQLNFQFRARIDYRSFEDLFQRRLDGEGIKVAKALEYNFRRDPKTPSEKRINLLIEKWIDQENKEDSAKLTAQENRLLNAVEKLKTKETKKALEDRRIATHKIEWYKNRIERRSLPKPEEQEARIWPFWYFPMIYFDGTENVIAPFRYHMRPEGKPESFDLQFDGTYNARRDRLHKMSGAGSGPVPWWEATFGKKHGIMVIHRFFENVSEHRYLGKISGPGEKEKNVVVSFDPGQGREMIVPLLYNNWRSPGMPEVNGAAAITFNPPEEVSAAGHDRCVGRLKAENVEAYLHPKGLSLDELDRIVDDHEQYHFKAELAA